MDHVCKNEDEPKEGAGWAEDWDQELVIMEQNVGVKEPGKDITCCMKNRCKKEEKENRGDEGEVKEVSQVESVDEKEEIDEGLTVEASSKVEKIGLGGGHRSQQEEHAKTEHKRGDSDREARDVVTWERRDHWEETTQAEEETGDTKSKAKVSGPFLWYNPVTVAQLFIAGWRCLFLVLKTLETALAVSPRSSPYSLDLLCSLKHLSVPQSRQEVRQRFMDNYAAFSGEYYRLLRSLVCCCVCRYAFPYRVVMAVVFLVLCGFIPLEDRRVGPYLMPRDFQQVFLCFMALCVSGVLDIAAWCLILASPCVLLHLLLHDSASSSHRPIFSNLVWS